MLLVRPRGMTELFRRLIKKTPLRAPLSWLLSRRRQRQEMLAWEANGRPVPPPHAVKQAALRQYSRDWGLRVLVETGTYRGDMVEAMRGQFDTVYSIELGRDLFEAAQRRFQGTAGVELIHGDSGTQVKALVGRLSQPALFWLDGHYSAGDTARGAQDTPILQELDCILRAGAPDHVAIVDDARCFGRDSGYPSLDELISFVRARRPHAQVAVQDDMIRITPGQPG